MIAVKYRWLVLMLLTCFAGCQHIEKQKDKITDHYKPHRITSLRDSGGNVKIDWATISNDENLSYFITDLKDSKMTLSKTLIGIPPFIKTFLVKLTKDSFSIAEPGKQWNCCDDIWDDKLPNRELICQGVDESLFVINYKTGGIGVEEHLIAISYNNHKVTDFWTGTTLSDLTDKNSITRYLTTSGNKHGFPNI